MIEFIVVFYTYAQLLTMFLIIVCGSLFMVLGCLMLSSEMIRRIMTHIGGYNAFIDYLWNMKKYKDWLRRGDE